MTEEELKALLENAALSEEPHPEEKKESEDLIEDIRGFFDGPRVLPPQPEQTVPQAQPADAPSFIPDPENPLPVRETAEAMPFAGYPEEKKQKHGWIAALFAAVILLMIGFAVFCIVMDLRTGTTAGGYRAGDVIEVKLEQHDKPADAAAAEGERSAAGVAKKVMPSIVQIYTYSEGAATGTGSGIILTEDGYIATNAHVVKDADAYAVKLFDEGQSDKTYDAILVGHDSKTDLAVLKISLSGLHPAELGNSDQVELGESVFALGNPAGLSGSITVGIISGMNRKVRANAHEYEMDCFQTDAAISPGNSGGALVNLSGQVIGITSSKYGRSIMTGAGYEGLGFAIMINEAMPIIKELMEQGYVSGRVRIGIEFYENAIAHQKAAAEEVTLPPQLDGTGIQINGIAEDSDLVNTILKPGEWILAMNGREVSDYDSVNKAIEGLAAGDTVHCRCARIKDDGRLETFEIDFKLLEDQSGEF